MLMKKIMINQKRLLIGKNDVKFIDLLEDSIKYIYTLYNFYLTKNIVANPRNIE